MAAACDTSDPSPTPHGDTEAVEEDSAWVNSVRDQIDTADQGLLDFWLTHGDNPDRLDPAARKKLECFTSKYHHVLAGSLSSPSPSPSPSPSQADPPETPLSRVSFASLNHSNASEGYPAVNRNSGSRFAILYGGESTGWRGHGPGGQFVPVWQQMPTMTQTQAQAQAQIPAGQQDSRAVAVAFPLPPLVAGPASSRPAPGPGAQGQVLRPRQVKLAMNHQPQGMTVAHATSSSLSSTTMGLPQEHQAFPFPCTPPRQTTPWEAGGASSLSYAPAVTIATSMATQPPPPIQRSATRPTVVDLEATRSEIHGQIARWRNAMQEAVEAEAQLKALQTRMKEMLDAQAAMDAVGRGCM